MNKADITSQITFIYVDDMVQAAEFFTNELGLELVYDPGWSKVWRTAGHAFVGAVNTADGSIEIPCRGGSLISLTVNNIHQMHEHLSALGKYTLTPIKTVKDIGLESFFFKGPQGYDFEIQHFTDKALDRIF